MKMETISCSPASAEGLTQHPHTIRKGDGKALGVGSGWGWGGEQEEKPGHADSPTAKICLVHFVPESEIWSLLLKMEAQVVHMLTLVC